MVPFLFFDVIFRTRWERLDSELLRPIQNGKALSHPRRSEHKKRHDSTWASTSCVCLFSEDLVELKRTRQAYTPVFSFLHPGGSQHVLTPTVTVRSKMTTCNDVYGTRVWYFAYGSNMLSLVMERRGVKPLGAKTVAVYSHILTFDIFGVPYGEPAMAGITERPADYEGQAVHGVAYLLSGSDYHRLLISEGAGIAYREIVIESRILGGVDRTDIERTRSVTERVSGEELNVRALVPRYPFRPNALPSARYLVSFPWPHSPALSPKRSKQQG